MPFPHAFDRAPFPFFLAYAVSGAANTLVQRIVKRPASLAERAQEPRPGLGRQRQGLEAPEVSKLVQGGVEPL
jgi:hypothetical protein